MNIDKVVIHTTNGRTYQLSIPVNGGLQTVIKDAFLEQLISASEVANKLESEPVNEPIAIRRSNDMASIISRALGDRLLSTNPRNKKRFMSTSNQTRFNKAVVKKLIESGSKSLHEDDFWSMSVAQGIDIKRATVGCYLSTMVLAGILNKSEVTPKSYRINNQFISKHK